MEARGKRAAFSKARWAPLCASTAPSASTGPVRVRQNGSRGGNGELDRRRPRTAVDPVNDKCSHPTAESVQIERSSYPGKTVISGT